MKKRGIVEWAWQRVVERDEGKVRERESKKVAEREELIMEGCLSWVEK